MSLPKRKHVPLVQRVWLSVEEVAEAAGIVFGKNSTRSGEINVQKARRWLKNAGALVKRGSRWYTTRARLRQAFPEEVDHIIAGLPE